MTDWIQEGDTAPDFNLKADDGRDVKLSDFRGKPVVLYFYPKDDTPGCTKEACAFRDRRQDMEERGAVVLGVSPDPVSRVAKFHDKQSLSFRLLADEDHAVCEQYGVWMEKTNYGKTYWGAQRATYLIDAGGTIATVFPKVSPKTHDDVVLAALADMRGAPA